MKYTKLNKTETYYRLLQECNETYKSIKEEIYEDLDDDQIIKFKKFERLPDELKVFLYAHNVYGRGTAKDLLGLHYNDFSFWYKENEELKPFLTGYKRYSKRQIKNKL